MLNALDARARGATILTRTALASARRDGAEWLAELEDRRDGTRRRLRTKVIVNATGPWVEQVLGGALGISSDRRVRLVKGSHLVTRRFWDGNQAYLLQNADKRVIFVNPYEDDLALIGTTDIPVEGRPEDARDRGGRDSYLLDVLGRYFRQPPTPADIVYSFSGVRPLYDDSAANPSAVTRDYVFDVEPTHPDGRAPLLSVFGGKITTFRKLAEHALDRLAPHLPQLGPAWTHRLLYLAATCRRRISRAGSMIFAPPIHGCRMPWRGTMAGSMVRVPKRCLPAPPQWPISAGISERSSTSGRPGS